MKTLKLQLTSFATSGHLKVGEENSWDKTGEMFSEVVVRSTNGQEVEKRRAVAALDHFLLQWKLGYGAI